MLCWALTRTEDALAYPGLGVVAPARQTTTETSRKKNMRNTPMPRPMTRVSPFSARPSTVKLDDEDI